MIRYMVVEIWSREVVSVTEAPSVKVAVEKANELLKKHAKECNVEIDLDDYENCDGYNEEWDCAKYYEKGNGLVTNAWANWRQEPWDVHVVELKVYGNK